MIPKELKYTKEHEWVRLLDGGIAEVGITDFAQDQLGDIVYVEVPEIGRKLTKDEAFGVVESVKTVSDVYSPLSGEVVAVNEMLCEDGDSFTPEVINKDAYGKGWIIRIKIADSAETETLLDAAAYKAVTEEEG